MSIDLVGRATEVRQIGACLAADRHVLLEGPVGVGKTRLALAVTARLDRPTYRVDGDGRYTEQKLAGWFDPPVVIRQGYSSDAFIPGPLVSAMRAGGILLVNELNRLPEGVQNVMLPAMDERRIVLPHLSEVRAEEGFGIIATQNPKEFVATSHLSEAILDRFELVRLDYQCESDEVEIVRGEMHTGTLDKETADRLARAGVRAARATRNNPRIRRGASVRAAVGISDIAASLISDGVHWDDALRQAIELALATRIVLERDLDSLPTGEDASQPSWVDELVEAANEGDGQQKKKPCCP